MCGIGKYTKSVIDLKKNIFITLILCCYVSLWGQTEMENLQKYQYYRQRFDTYFMVVGNNLGESLVVCNRNRNLGANICFGQHGVHFGYYLGMLATEYALLERDNQPLQATETLNELVSALDAYCKQLDKCENYFGEEKRLDGFFIRENVPIDYLDSTKDLGQYHLSRLNKNRTSEQVYDKNTGSFFGLEKGEPGYANALFEVEAQKLPMSQDEAYGVMMGLALVKKCVPNLAEKAKYLFELITLHIIGKNGQNGCPNEGYMIKKPDCTSISESTGGNTAFFAYGIAAAAEKVTEKPRETFINTFSAADRKYSVQNYWHKGKLYTPIGKNNMYYIWKICGNGVPGQQEWNRAMASTLGAIGDSWGKRTDKAITKNVYWTKGEKKHDWRTFYLSLWRFLHDKQGNETEKQMIVKELNSAPQYGPYNYKSADFPTNFAGGGWAYTYRYRATISEQFEGSTFVGTFNGLDYMLMYNLYQLLYATSDNSLPKYHK